MNPRLPHAGRTLCDEIIEIDEDATFEAGDPDGLGVYRSVAVFAGNLTPLADTLRRVSQVDRRIKAVEDTDDYLLVRFPLDQIVWSRARFGLGEIYSALTEAEPEPTQPTQSRASGKKRTTKKAAAK